MDTLAHGLYGAALTAPGRDEKKMLAGALAGMLPDVIVYAAAFAKLGIGDGLKFMTEPNPAHVNGLLTLYHWTHSMFVPAAVLIILLVFKRQWWFLAFSYALHIFFDIFTHTGVFATRFLFPFSLFRLDTFSYPENLWAWEINYGLLIGIYFLIYTKFYKPYLKK